jgi:hypothetical protein
MLALLDSRRPRIAHEKYHVACECSQRGIHGILLAPSHDVVRRMTLVKVVSGG